MERKYEVLLTMRVQDEWRELGRFYLGEDLEQVKATFGRLKGQPSNYGWIQIELREICGRTWVRHSRISCTLDELSENCRLITKDAFKRFNLERESASSGTKIGEYLNMAGFGSF